MGSDQTFRAVLIVTLVSVFLIAVSGRLRARTNEKLDRRQEGLFMLVTLRTVGLVLWVAVIVYAIDPASMAWSAVPLPEWVRWAGLPVAAVAVGLLAWTLRSLGKNLTDTVVTRREHSLVTRGPYRFVRHPFYDSVALTVLAAGLMMANGFVLSAGGLFICLFIVRTRKEEENLLARFGDPYRTYVERTGRFLPRRRSACPD